MFKDNITIEEFKDTTKLDIPVKSNQTGNVSNLLSDIVKLYRVVTAKKDYKSINATINRAV